MSATPWTPGPWTWTNGHEPINISTYENNAYSNNPSLYGPNNEDVVGCDEYWIFGPWQNDGAMRANCRLIQHAPDMAEALECLAAMAAHYPTVKTYGTRVRSGPIYSVADVRLGEAAITVEDLHRARTLLARIRGDAP